MTFDSEAARAALAAIKSIPVVMLHVNNPVAAGYVKSLAYPGANITGLGGFADLPGKNMQILKEMKPKLSKVLLLVDPADPASAGWRDEARTGAGILGIKLVERSASNATELQRLFAALKPGTAEAVLKQATAPCVRRSDRPPRTLKLFRWCRLNLDWIRNSADSTSVPGIGLRSRRVKKRGRY